MSTTTTAGDVFYSHSSSSASSPHSTIMTTAWDHATVDASSQDIFVRRLAAEAQDFTHSAFSPLATAADLSSGSNDYHNFAVYQSSTTNTTNNHSASSSPWALQPQQASSGHVSPVGSMGDHSNSLLLSAVSAISPLPTSSLLQPVATTVTSVGLGDPSFAQPGHGGMASSGVSARQGNTPRLYPAPHPHAQHHHHIPQTHQHPHHHYQHTVLKPYPHTTKNSFTHHYPQSQNNTAITQNTHISHSPLQQLPRAQPSFVPRVGSVTEHHHRTQLRSYTPSSSASYYPPSSNTATASYPPSALSHQLPHYHHSPAHGINQQPALPQLDVYVSPADLLPPCSTDTVNSMEFAVDEDMGMQESKTITSSLVQRKFDRPQSSPSSSDSSGSGDTPLLLQLPAHRRSTRALSMIAVSRRANESTDSSCSSSLSPLTPDSGCSYPWMESDAVESSEGAEENEDDAEYIDPSEARSRPRPRSSTSTTRITASRRRRTAPMPYSRPTHRQPDQRAMYARVKLEDYLQTNPEFKPVDLMYTKAGTARKNQPIPQPVVVPNLHKKSRGRKVPVIDLTASSSGSGDDLVGGGLEDGAGWYSGEGSGEDMKPIVGEGSPLQRTFMCTVKGCGKGFVRSEHLKRHVRSIHTYEKPHPCPHPGCGKRFSRKDNLAQHYRVHT